MSTRTVITGTGHYVPPRIVTNFDLEKVMNTSDEWIRQRTGIITRHHADEGVGTSDLAVEAARLAIENAGIEPSDIDFVVAATLSPDHYFPGIGVQIQQKLGLGTVPALDVRNQCSGFLYALSVGDQFVRTGTYKKVLVVAAELQSANMDYSDRGRDMAVLFGDGAGACILEPGKPGEERGILSTHLYSDGNFVSTLWMDKPSSVDRPTWQAKFFEDGSLYPHMDGRRVFIHACERMPEALRTGLEYNHLSVDDIATFIPHQANDRISLMVAKNMGIPLERVVRNIERYGNTTAASIPIALDESVRDGRIKPGDIVAMAAFGSGYTWGSAFIRW